MFNEIKNLCIEHQELQEKNRKIQSTIDKNELFKLITVEGEIDITHEEVKVILELIDGKLKDIEGTVDIIVRNNNG